MERQLATSLFKHFPNIHSYYFTQGKVCYDGIVTKQDGKFIVFEVKVRDFSVDKYPDYILQLDKLKNLAKTATAQGTDTIYYINFFKTDDPNLYDYIVFNLSARIKEWKDKGIKPEIEKKWMNSATFISNSKVEKEVLMLKKEPHDMWGNIKMK